MNFYPAIVQTIPCMEVITQQPVNTASGGGGTDSLLLEDGFFLLIEDGSHLLLE